MSKIDFYIPDDEIIPRKLRLKYNDKIIEYTVERNEYTFRLLNDWKTEEAEQAIRDIADMFEKRKFDDYRLKVDARIEWIGYNSYRVSFKVYEARIGSIGEEIYFNKLIEKERSKWQTSNSTSQKDKSSPKA